MFFKFVKRKEEKREIPKLSQQEEFVNILRFAEKVIRDYNSTKGTGTDLGVDRHPICEVIHILGRKIQSDYMVRLLTVEDESDLESFISPFMFKASTILTLDGRTYSDLINKKNIRREADLSIDTVIPWPWKRYRLANALTKIGPGRLLGPWKEDKNNHFLELWLPLGLYWVNGGNHSISVGILQGNGKVSTDEVYDISQIYDHVTCDGSHYIREFDKEIIGKVDNIELAAIFEIGRLLTRQSISF
ncbi:DUF6710 family protein [Priestia megaterium]|uniref:DUF6710 family protein n=1 Tax=Priestia megaterium TaxID=1404 RepID=UPI003012FF81